MIDQEARIRLVVRDHLKKVALGELVGYAISQGAFLLATSQGPKPQPFWMITVTMKNPELGAGDIAKAEILAGIVPTDEVLRETVVALLNKCRVDAAKFLTGRNA
jgi:hypothetical protein